jgi:hypothetical protein
MLQEKNQILRPETAFLGFNIFHYPNLELNVAYLCCFSSGYPCMISSFHHFEVSANFCGLREPCGQRDGTKN